ncbi:restriction endonuclease subunit S [Flavobacterium psychrophilum]|uniref:restriction endonuclease subunit S n=1 Tax=Flavobacterium psychrophilum TaxID=96345 RepID=UPI001D0614F4|nr:restriction endonuclease subunit S [Flavobacterium psychrophilum]MCB6099424.1 restriction endonuclease subunit S [Flavobacterium psychrophilum]
MKSSYKKLGKYIQEVNKRDTDKKVTKLLGVSIRKVLMPSIANIIGTDMSTYKIIQKNQFAYGPVTSRNGDKISVALLDEYDEAIVSQAYTVFEVIDKNELLPEYLMMWFRRPEFDRYARFKSHGSAREIFGWDEMCDTELPIPSIEKQKEIVKEYHILVNRIELNNQLITKLEETAQAIYKQWFVDFEFPDANGLPYKSNGGVMIESELGEIPKGWNVSEIGSEFDITIGRTPPRIERKWFNNSDKESLDWISIKDIVNSGTYIFNTNESLTMEAIKKFTIPIIPVNTTILSFKMTVGKLTITTKEMLSNEAIAHFKITDKTILTTEFIYCFFDVYGFNKLGTTSSIVNSINTKIIKEIKIIVPTLEVINNFNKLIKSIFISKRNTEHQTVLLENLMSLLLSKMATIEN